MVLTKRCAFAGALSLTLVLVSCSETSGPTAPVAGTVSFRALRGGDAQPLPGAELEIRRGADGTVVFQGTTGPDGWATATLEVGWYVPSFAPPAGYTFFNGFDLPLVPATIVVHPGSDYRRTFTCYPLPQ